MCPIGFISRNYDSQSKAVEEWLGRLNLKEIDMLGEKWVAKVGAVSCPLQWTFATTIHNPRQLRSIDQQANT
jgi:hypothetical protein